MIFEPRHLGCYEYWKDFQTASYIGAMPGRIIQALRRAVDIALKKNKKPDQEFAEATPEISFPCRKEISFRHSFIRKKSFSRIGSLTKRDEVYIGS